MAFKPQTKPPPADGSRVKITSDAETLRLLRGENSQLRATLARLESDGVRRDVTTLELKHRIGNLLAVVQAVARQTFRESEAASVDDFAARMLALGEAQNVLIESEKAPAGIARVISNALAPHCADGDRAAMSGPEFTLNGRRAHALTLALHELATNATKYGALSVGDGRVEVVWTTEGGALDLLWREQGGPPVVAPTRRGFGSRLITRNLALAFGGEVDLSFMPAGVACRLRAPALATGDSKTGVQHTA